ncbi:circularly permuted type 2 ATP-grasp protein [Pyruvatibacter sp.]|uniref:circularly permuted type 2 ATP-grasp protein n=1 Tax=Pyruvatibacter sp. TaxID=1981328 RepID=UPI0032EFF042
MAAFLNNPTSDVQDAAQLLRSYHPIDGTVDEMLDASGQIRPHWRGIIDGLAQLGPQMRSWRWDTARKLIRENGITYNIYGDPQGLRRPWGLDFIPLVLSAQEWTGIEAGLKQRARLLNAIARDVYGEQRLIKEGVLPASLMLGNPHFLRPMHGIAVPNDTFLHFYAVDLARGPDGRWWVLADRTQAPSGAGYAIENRIIMSRSLPEIFEKAQVHKLASFFGHWRDNLMSMMARDDGRAVLLTPGPYNETYFEHVYLARYLGLTLVEGDDLTVRDDVLYLKTLDGLKRVDMVLRRVDAEFCDPLELRGDSALGVPGMVRAVRAGNLVVANALGSGVLETQALHAFMPAVAKHFEGSDLLLPDIATWWCGDDAARQHVVANLDTLAIREATNTHRVMAPAASGTAGSQIDAEARSHLLRAMQLRGADYVAQELVTLSSSPVLEDDELKARPVSLRCYVAAVGNDYVVMPGGMARFSTSRDPHAISMQSGDGSKDAWVLSDKPVSSFSMLPNADRAVSSRRAGGDMPSRAADNLYWLGRYQERADATLRLLRACVMRLAEPEAYPGGSAALSRLAVLLHARTDYEIDAEEGAGPLEVLLERLNALLTDSALTNSFPGAIENVQRTAYLVRDRLSMDSFRIITEFSPSIPPLSRAIAFDTTPMLATLNQNLTVVAALAGLQAENSTRGPAWLFMDMGKRIERARTIISMLHTLVVDGEPAFNGSLALLLELADSFMTYRTRYLAAPQLAPMLDLVLLDETNPRSLAYQVQALATSVSRLPKPPHDGGLPQDQRVLTALGADIRLAQLDEVCAVDSKGHRDQLDAMLTRMDGQINDLSDAISRIYFAHAASQRISFAPRAQASLSLAEPAVLPEPGQALGPASGSGRVL